SRSSSSPPRGAAPTRSRRRHRRCPRWRRKIPRRCAWGSSGSATSCSSSPGASSGRDTPCWPPPDPTTPTTAPPTGFASSGDQPCQPTNLSFFYSSRDATARGSIDHAVKC
uniref:Uncharacterized protein n=1 Tax=Triticum urartu TaxID=4572 RepID=A0A8R7QWQ7_TRIUA